MVQSGIRLGMCAAVLAATLLPGDAATGQNNQEKTAAKAAAAQQIVIVRRPGQEEGQAEIPRAGAKPRKVAAHAVAAWMVRGGGAALVVVVAPAKGTVPKHDELRYYDLDSGRRRTLGESPVTAATLTETKASDDHWAFALSGNDPKTGAPVVAVGDDQALTGVLPGASSPEFHEGTLRYASAGTSHEVRLGVLLGTELNAIYAPQQKGQTSPKYLQVFPNGAAMVDANDGTVRRGRWTTDGTVIEVRDPKETAAYSVTIAELERVSGVPAGARVSVRLLAELSSKTTHEGDAVKAVAVAPVVANGKILIPTGAMFEGRVVQANSTGWGFKHETASLTIAWTKAALPDGRELALDARVYAVENAREKVTVDDKGQGKIQGIRSTGTPGHTAENGILTFAGIDPVAYIFASAAGSAVLGFAEPEILYPAGTELLLEVVRPLETAQVYPPAVAAEATTEEQRAELEGFVKSLPYLTRTKGSNKPSDVTNLVFVGPAAGLERAFKAAGWLPAEELTAGSTFRTIKTISGNQTYTQAPMSVLLLEERAPVLALSKTTNTFASRHHLRVYPTAETREGHTVLTASSTQDIGIAFSRKQKTFIHAIDEHIDNERAKVVNDLVFTGCVESLDMVARPWVPRDAYNSTGDRLLTDGAAAVLRVSDCTSPHTTPETPAVAPARPQRIVRDTSLTVRSDVYRGNFIYQGIAGTLALKRYLRSSSELPEDPGAWLMTDASGTEYKTYALPGSTETEGVSASSGLEHRKNVQPSPEDLAAIQKAKESHKWDPPRYELWLEGGYMHMRENYLTFEEVALESSDPNKTSYYLDLLDRVDDGWAAGGTVTLNSWRHFSNEFSYFRQQVKYELDSVESGLNPANADQDYSSDLVAAQIGLVTRQFEYNLLVHPTRPSSRIRPYLAAGPVLQLVALNGAPLKKPAGPFNIGLKNIGLILAAFDFGRTPPLEGGGIFQFGLQYGAGVKYRVSPRVMLRADWRETWSKNPDIIATSYDDYFDAEDANLDPSYSSSVFKLGPEQKFLQDRYTVGIAFTF